MHQISGAMPALSHRQVNASPSCREIKSETKKIHWTWIADRPRYGHGFPPYVICFVAGVMIFATVTSGWAAEPRPEEAEAVAEILTHGGIVTFDGVNAPRRVTGVSLTHANAMGLCLERLKRLADLQSLDLEGQEVGDAALESVKVLTRLRSLNLGHTGFGDAGSKWLKGLAALESLNLESGDVSDVGLENLKGLTNLQSLSLAGTHVTDVGLQNLKGLTNLRSLNLDRTDVADVSLDNLMHWSSCVHFLSISHLCPMPRWTKSARLPGCKR